MSRHIAPWILCALMTVPAAVQAQNVDDRDLLRSRGATPNVLVIMDSSGSMGRDLETDSHVFIGGGEDPHAKLSQVKYAFKRFLDTDPDFNLGFTFYERERLRMKNHLFLYRVDPNENNISWRWRAQIEEDGSFSWEDSNRTTTLDANTLTRLGNEVPRNTTSPYVFPPLFGEVGKYSYADWSRSNYPDNDKKIWVNGTTYDGEYRVDGYLVEPTNGSGYYYPAWDYYGPGMQTALATFNSLHDFYAPTVYSTTATPEEKLFAWNSLILARQDLQTVLDDNQIGLETLTLEVKVRRCTGYIRDSTGECINGSGWVDVITHTRHLHTAYGVSPSDLDASDTTIGFYAGKTIPQDYTSTGSSRTAYGFSDSCDGFQGFDVDGTRVPIIPIPTDDDPPLSEIMYRYLNEQGQMQLFFPTRASGYKYWPYFFEDDDSNPSFDERGVWVTDRAVMGTGSTPIGQSLNDARWYFSNIINQREDMLRECRKDFVILLTDGLHTCGGTSPCTEAENLGDIDVPVYVIGYGMGTSGNSLSCVAENSGGELYLPDNVEELVAALLDIGVAIEERTRGFASPIVPSVETTAEQTAYIATFTPRVDRSVWRGHVRAYEIDPLTGTIKNLPASGIPMASTALWDVGDILGARDLSADDRSMYYGTASGSNVPGTRESFTIPWSDDTKRDFLGGRIFYPEIYTDSDDDRDTLRQVVNFVRGVTMEFDSGGDITVFGRDPAQYGWCGSTGDEDEDNPIPPCASSPLVEKLGDIFHSKPKLVGNPECFPCWLRNYNGYRDDPNTGDIDDGFFASQKRRRRVLYVGANDGTLHAIDAGLWDPDGDNIPDPPIEPRYDVGSGRELFAWVPKGVFTKLDDIATTPNHEWTVDGSPTVGDVFIDPAHNGTPTASQREWRTVLMSGLRRGGSSYFALDITQPDADADNNGIPDSPVTGDVSTPPDATDTARDPSCRSNSTGCAGAWPAFMWELTDTNDEDNNTTADMGDTWSQPVISFVRVSKSGSDEDRMMAFFGGGHDPLGLNVTNPAGNFIYGVDVETGHILFKHAVDGQVPGGVAAHDDDIDGFVERLYWGTTTGKVYRMEIREPGPISNTAYGERIGSVTVDSKTYWQPQLLFDAGTDQPFFMTPSLVPITVSPDGVVELAIAIGSGNRANIFEEPSVLHSFYVFADRPKSGGAAITEADLAEIAVDDADTTDNYLFDVNNDGWYMPLIAPGYAEDGTFESSDPSYEKTNTPAVILENYVIFSTFTPSDEVVLVEITDPDTDEVIGYACRFGGGARTYVVNLFNANPILGDDRFTLHPEGAAMATEPVLYLGADGRLHVIQALDNLRLDEPVAPIDVPVRITSWKEN